MTRPFPSSLLAVLAAACASCTCGCISSALLAVAAISSPGLMSALRTETPVPDVSAQTVPAEPGEPDAVERWLDSQIEQIEAGQRRRLAELGARNASRIPESAGTPDAAPDSGPEDPVPFGTPDSAPDFEPENPFPVRTPDSAPDFEPENPFPVRTPDPDPDFKPEDPFSARIPDPAPASEPEEPTADVVEDIPEW